MAGAQTSCSLLSQPAELSVLLPRGGEHRTPCEAETYLQTEKKSCIQSHVVAISQIGVSKTVFRSMSCHDEQ